MYVSCLRHNEVRILNGFMLSLSLSPYIPRSPLRICMWHTHVHIHTSHNGTNSLHFHTFPNYRQQFRPIPLPISSFVHLHVLHVCFFICTDDSTRYNGIPSHTPECFHRFHILDIVLLLLMWNSLFFVSFSPNMCHRVVEWNAIANVPCYWCFWCHDKMSQAHIITVQHCLQWVSLAFCILQFAYNLTTQKSTNIDNDVDFTPLGHF